MEERITPLEKFLAVLLVVAINFIVLSVMAWAVLKV